MGSGSGELGNDTRRLSWLPYPATRYSRILLVPRQPASEHGRVALLDDGGQERERHNLALDSGTEPDDDLTFASRETHARHPG